MSRDGKAMYVKSVPVGQARSCGEFTDYDGSHVEEWGRVVRVREEWRDLDYEQVPRGRVVFIKPVDGDGQFVVYLPAALKKYEKRIAAAFHLPQDSTRFDYSDKHYSFRTQLER
jgi:hypothetical protein